MDGNGIITSTELRLACRYLCKQFQIDIKTVKSYNFLKNEFTPYFQERNFRKYMLKSDADNDGTLNFDEFKSAVKYAQRMIKSKRQSVS